MNKSIYRLLKKIIEIEEIIKAQKINTLLQCVNNEWFIKDLDI